MKRADQYAKGVDAAEEALPGIKQEILTGAIKPSETAVVAVAKAKPEERTKLVTALRTSDARWGGNHKKPAPEVKYHKPRVTARKADLEKIRAISAEMECGKPPATDDFMINSIELEIESFIELCNRIFQEYPGLLANRNHRADLIQVMQKLKQYILNIEVTGGVTE